MSKKIEMPDWFPRALYTRELSPEEWLFEIYKRAFFNCQPPYILSKELKADYFKGMIEHDDRQGLLEKLRPQLGQPIKTMSVSDVFRLCSLITNSSWYQNHPDKAVFESAIDTLAKGGQLSEGQKIIFARFYETPCDVFHESSNQERWFINREITHLSGVPVTIDPCYNKDDCSKELKRILKQWVGKQHDVSTKFDTWLEYKILAVFDLRVWLKIQEIKYSNIDLHNLLWPKGRISSHSEDLVNPYDDIDRIIEESEKIITLSTVRMLWLACESRKYQMQNTES